MKLNHKINQLLTTFSTNLEHFKNFMDIFPMGLVILDANRKFMFYNQAQARMDGLEPAEVLGRSADDVWRPLTGPRLISLCQKSRQPILGYICQYDTFKGRRVNCTGWIFPIFDHERVSGTITVTSHLRDGLGTVVKAPETIPSSEVSPDEGSAMKSIVGHNAAFRKALMTVKVNAANPYPILIAGETGSGKELMAKLVHESSARSAKPFMAINCSAIPEALLEGLLFGTVKGSFTGSIDRPGLLEEANGGTLYLDEIDSMPLDLQPKLLRAIQEMKVSRVGSTRDIKLDLKLVSSVSAHSYQTLNSGKLRADLFYRLAVAVVNVPPLRTRLDDLQPLTRHFIQKYLRSAKQRRRNIQVDSGLWELMNKYHWPGNVRELEHMIFGSLAMLQQEETIELRHVPEHYLQAFAHDGGRPEDGPGRPPGLGPASWKPQAAPVRRTLAEERIERLKNEAGRLTELLSATGGNVSRAAKTLGISRQALSYRLLKMGIEPKDFK